MQRYLAPHSKTFVPVSCRDVPLGYATTPASNIPGVNVSLVTTRRGVYTMYHNATNTYVDIRRLCFEEVEAASTEFRQQSHTLTFLMFLLYFVASIWGLCEFMPKDGLVLGLANALVLVCIVLVSPLDKAVLVIHTNPYDDKRECFSDASSEDSEEIDNTEPDLGDSEDDEHLAQLQSHRESEAEPDLGDSEVEHPDASELLTKHSSSDADVEDTSAPEIDDIGLTEESEPEEPFDILLQKLALARVRKTLQEIEAGLYEEATPPINAGSDEPAS